jgi:hypothetical protein
MKWILAWCSLLGSAASAQEMQPVPSREPFIEQSCMPAMVQELGDAPAQRIFARAACECSYRLLADRQVMTREQFDAAGTLCRAEFEQDNAAFIQKYAR